MHHFLGLDAKAAPFHPPSKSARKGSPQHRALRSALIDAFQKKAHPLMKTAAMRRTRSSYLEPDRNTPHRTQSYEEANAHIMGQIMTFLLEDEARAYYAKVFVPVLHRAVWPMTPDNSEKRLKTLEKLCRW
ncbi:hypothetical protein NW767_012528 [Fusarium falciforme]|nr:hypothetical protein NW767_012528 [Fusarium falciforme]